MGITGVILVILGVICIASPISTILSLAWIIGLLAIVSGVATFLNWLSMRRYFPQSGTILLSAVLLMAVGVIILRNDTLMASMLPLLFALFLIVEGFSLAIRSFDYRKVGFDFWWLNLILGIAAAILGLACISVPGVGGASLSAFVGVGIIVTGVVYLVALSAVNRFERKLRKDPWIDEQ